MIRREDFTAGKRNSDNSENVEGSRDCEVRCHSTGVLASTAPYPRLYAIGFDLAMEMASFQADGFGSLRDIPLVLFQFPLKVFLFEGGFCLSKRWLVQRAGGGIRRGANSVE